MDEEEAAQHRSTISLDASFASLNDESQPRAQGPPRGLHPPEREIRGPKGRPGPPGCRREGSARAPQQIQPQRRQTAVAVEAYDVAQAQLLGVAGAVSQGGNPGLDALACWVVRGQVGIFPEGFAPLLCFPQLDDTEAFNES